MPSKNADVSKLWSEYQKGVTFKSQIGLYDTVHNNENFFIGRQWEGITANGLPTPVFNFLKRIVRHLVSSIVSDNIKIRASKLTGGIYADPKELDYVIGVINSKFECLFEYNKLDVLLREEVRNACVDGDGCLYTYFDPDVKTGQSAEGEITTELVENTRIIFGNPNDRRVQKQPWLMVSRREMLDDVKRRAKDPDSIVSDTDDTNNYHEGLSDDKCTVAIKFWKEYGKDVKRPKIMACEFTNGSIVRDPWDTGLTLYPITWFSVDYVQSCYHGQATVTGLLDNQIGLNKMLAMTQLSISTTAFPKILYDKTRIAKWDNRVGAAIAMNGGGDVSNAAKIMDAANNSPQIHQFMQFYIEETKELMGATSASLGESKSYNTSALVANQRAAAIPHDFTKSELYQSIEDLGRIYIDHMRAYYGRRMVMKTNQETGIDAPADFDYEILNRLPLSIKLDVGAASYWSEITSMQMLENLLTQGKIDIIHFLDRIPDGLIPKKDEWIAELKAQQAQMQNALAAQQRPGQSGGQQTNSTAQPIQLPTNQGNAGLQKTISNSAKAS